MTVQTQELGVGNEGGGKKPDTPNAKKISKKSVIAFFLLPGIIPQIKELGRGGFGYLAFLIAMVYRAVRILPQNHPYTKSENFGKFGIRQVIGEAANHVKLDRKHLDQVIIFFAILAGMVIMLLQIGAIIMVMFSGEAWAGDIAPDSFGGIFATNNPDTDIAFHMIREVFGLPEMFGDFTPTAFHTALQTLFQFYNLAILVVAILVFIYYVIVVVAETAQTGTPFGQRFSHIYAPIRLVIAIGLLVPLNYGFNGAQYITFFAAKTGSGFATTGWSEFNKSMDKVNPMGASNSSLIATTKTPDIQGYIKAMSVIVACREAYKLIEADGAAAKEIKAYTQTEEEGYQEINADSYESIASEQEAAGIRADILITFGAFSDTAETEFVPYCGQVAIPNNLSDIEYLNATDDASPKRIQEYYFRITFFLWESSILEYIGEIFSKALDSDNATNPCGVAAPADEEGNPSFPTGTGGCEDAYQPHISAKETISSDTRSMIKAEIESIYEAIRADADLKITDEILERGWGGAGIWYNHIAEINGAYTQAVLSTPDIKKWPQVMEKVLEAKRNADGGFGTCETFEPNLADNTTVTFDRPPVDIQYAKIGNGTYKYWCEDPGTSNFFLDAASAIFGLEGLMSIRETAEDFEGNEVQVHPLAKLSALGRGLIESAIRNMAGAISASFLGGILGILTPQIGPSLQAASSMFVSIATIGLSIGFITFYILPFLPFMYFFFAVGGWVKSIFEAMVGAPLWALAHLRIDGDGLPGKMAMNGYFLIFEIFLRPILTIFGLIGGMATFTGLAIILNEIFDLVVINAGGVDLQNDDDALFSRHIIDVFFFTVVYAVILYMMAVSSFKMINLVPNNILRWLGQSVSSFSDQTEDPTQGLVQYAALGGARIGGQLAGGVTKLGEAGGALVGGVGSMAGLGGRPSSGSRP